MAATASAFHSSQAPQRHSESIGSVARPTLVITEDRQLRGAACETARGHGRSFHEEVRNSASPTETLLQFMESAYQAGAKSAGWDIEALRTHPPAREAAKLRRGN
jgi:hypothetical protein